jgi:hypothetical protein
VRWIKQFRENARGTGIAVGMVMTNQALTTVTDDQIEALRTEALSAADVAQAIMCGIALGEYPDDAKARTGMVNGHALAKLLSARDERRLVAMTEDEARSECARVIAYAAGEAS